MSWGYTSYRSLTRKVAYLPDQRDKFLVRQKQAFFLNLFNDGQHLNLEP